MRGEQIGEAAGPARIASAAASAGSEMARSRPVKSATIFSTVTLSPLAIAQDRCWVAQPSSCSVCALDLDRLAVAEDAGPCGLGDADARLVRLAGQKHRVLAERRGSRAGVRCLLLSWR